MVYKSKAPNPLVIDENTSISPVSDADFEAAGGVITTNSDPTPEEEFAAAAAQFRAVCGQIATFIDDPDFRGGFGEMAEFAQSEAYQENPVMGNTLAIQWSAANESGKYFGSKIGYGQPQWWYKAWELAEEE